MNPPLDIFGNLAWLNKWVKNLLGRVRALELNPGGGVPSLPATQIAFGDGDGKLSSSDKLTFNNGQFIILDPEGNQICDINSNQIVFGDGGNNDGGNAIILDKASGTFIYKNEDLDGKFGINTTETPSAALDVVGDIKSSGTVSDVNGVIKPYKVFSALVTQTTLNGFSDITVDSGDGDLILGVTYEITNVDGGPDFTNIGAPDNNEGTRFIATGVTPTSWGDGAELTYQPAAPRFIILENTIGNLRGGYTFNGFYYLSSSEGLFIENKTWGNIGSVPNGTYPPSYIVPVAINLIFPGLQYYVGIKVPNSNPDNEEYNGDDILNNTPIEIRVYN